MNIFHNTFKYTIFLKWWVCSGNTTVTNCRQTGDTVMKSHTTITRHQRDKTSSRMGNNRSPGSQHNVWRHHNLRCSKARHSELETVIRIIQTLKILRQFSLSAGISTIWINITEETWCHYNFQMLKGSLLRSQWWDLTQMQPVDAFTNVLVIYKNNDQMKN